MIRFNCDCGRVLQAPEEYAGQQAVCPACQRVNVVPADDAPGRVAVQPVAPPAVAPVRADEPRERYEDDRRPRRREERDRDRDRDWDRRRDRERRPTGNSGKAVAALVLGVTSVVCLLNLLTGLPAVILGLLALKDIKESRGRLAGKGMALTGLVLGIVGVITLLPLAVFGIYLPISQQKARVQSQNNLKQIGLAIHNYHDSNGYFVPDAIRSDDGRPLLSWRVAILPYIEQIALYRQFNLKEPWDSPTNRPLIAKMPKTYVVNGRKKAPEGETFYQGFSGPGTAFDPTVYPGRLSFPGGFPDGTSNTLLVVEAEQSVVWTKPEDLPYNPFGPLPRLGGHFSGGFNVLLGDASVRFVRSDVSESTLRALITRDAGDVPGNDF
jgi:hypothetical protein